MHQWLLHMTEAQRIYAVELIDIVLDVLIRPALVPLTRSSDCTNLRFSNLPDRRPGASIALSRGSLLLRTPLSPRRGRFAAELAGPAFPPSEATAADGGVAVMLGTLARWRAALSSPVTDATNAEVVEMASTSTRLLRGVVEAHRSDWEMSALQSSRKDGHVLQVYSREPNGRQLGCRFSSRPRTRGEGGITRELGCELDRVFGGRSHAHVVELERWRRYRLSFDETPIYCISPSPDPMLTLRALCALPAGARLVPTG